MQHFFIAFPLEIALELSTHLSYLGIYFVSLCLDQKSSLRFVESDEVKFEPNLRSFLNVPLKIFEVSYPLKKIAGVF